MVRIADRFRKSRLQLSRLSLFGRAGDERMRQNRNHAAHTARTRRADFPGTGFAGADFLFLGAGGKYGPSPLPSLADPLRRRVCWRFSCASAMRFLRAAVSVLRGDAAGLPFATGDPSGALPPSP